MGADLCLELPVCWSMSTAQNFALGGVSILKNMGCDTIMFGSENGDINELLSACKVLKSKEFKEYLNNFLNDGITFAAAREKAAKKAGLKGDILKGANNNLAIEYILASESIGADFEFITLKRQGAGHDTDIVDEKWVSASLLREKLKASDKEFALKYIPSNVAKLFLNNTANIERIEKAILAVLRTKTLEELRMLPDVSEGLENKLFNGIRIANNLETLYNAIKVKRYTHARIRRLVLSAFLGIDNSFFMKEPPYVRVLGFGSKGEEVLREKISKATVPVIMRATEIENLPDDSKKIFSWECCATDMYGLALEKPLQCGEEFRSKLIKTEYC